MNCFFLSMRARPYMNASFPCYVYITFNHVCSPPLLNVCLKNCLLLQNQNHPWWTTPTQLMENTLHNCPRPLWDIAPLHLHFSLGFKDDPLSNKSINRLASCSSSAAFVAFWSTFAGCKCVLLEVWRLLKLQHAKGLMGLYPHQANHGNITQILLAQFLFPLGLYSEAIGTHSSTLSSYCVRSSLMIYTIPFPFDDLSWMNG